MKRTITLGVIGLLMAAGVAQSNAANWVQPVTVTLTGHESGLPPGGTKINNKVILEALSGATVTNFVGGSPTPVSTTNTSIVSIPSTDVNVTNDRPLGLSTNNFTLSGTNGIFGTNGTLVFSNFPTSLTATGVVFETTGSTNIATNTLTLTLDTNAAVPTYTFTNFVTVSTTNATNVGFAYTNAFVAGTNGSITNAAGTNQALYISAVLQTNSTTNALIFSLEASYLTNIVTTTTSTGSNVVVTLPATAKGSALVLVTALPPGPAPLLGAASTNPPVFAIKSGTGKNVTLTDVSAFLSFVPLAGGSNNVVATTGTVSFGLVGVQFNVASGGLGPVSLAGTAFFKETDVNNKKAGAVVPTSIQSTAIGQGAFDATANNVVFSGTVNAGGGSVSQAVLTEP